MNTGEPPLCELLERGNDVAFSICVSGPGITWRISSWALSTSMPVGSPRSFRRIRPPSGSDVSREILATASTLEFTHVE